MQDPAMPPPLVSFRVCAIKSTTTGRLQGRWSCHRNSDLRPSVLSAVRRCQQRAGTADDAERRRL